MSRRLSAAALLALLPVAVSAQERPTLLDLLSPDRIIRTLMQTGIMSLRTQMDVKYGAMAVDFAGGRVSLTDVQLWPLPDWDDGGDCLIGIDRLVLQTAGLDELERLRLKVQATGLTAPQECLPPEPRAAILGPLALDRVVVPRLVADIDYDIASSGATALVYGTVQDVAAVELSATASYVWVDGRDDMDNPDPVVFLDSASLSVENLGGWDALRSLMPPPFVDPEQSPMVIEGMLGGMISGANRDAAGAEAEGDPSALSEAQSAFLASARAAWPVFLENPQRLVIETAMEGDTYIDFEAFEESPVEVFDTLRPVVGTAPLRFGDVIPAAQLTAALAGEALDPEDQRRTGIALVTGRGAPRNVGLGVDLLIPLAQDGDGDAALAAAQALEMRGPEDAYRLALIAGATERSGASALLDRLERRIGLARALALQTEIGGFSPPDTAALAQPFAVRDNAAQQLSGIGAVRNYTAALLWAMIGAATGDAETAAILTEIDARMAGETGENLTAWRAAEARASRLATDLWLQADLPGQLGGQ